MMDIKIGDIVFYQTTTFMGRIIRYVSDFKYSHVAVVVDFDPSGIPMVIESVAFTKSQLKPLVLDSKIAELHILRPCGMDDDKREAIVASYPKYLDIKYDHIGIVLLALGILFPTRANTKQIRRESSGAWCSEIVDGLMFGVGIDLVPDHDGHDVDIKSLYLMGEWCSSPKTIINANR